MLFKNIIGINTVIYMINSNTAGCNVVTSHPGIETGQLAIFHQKILVGV